MLLILPLHYALRHADAALDAMPLMLPPHMLIRCHTTMLPLAIRRCCLRHALFTYHAAAVYADVTLRLILRRLLPLRLRFIFDVFCCCLRFSPMLMLLIYIITLR